MSVGIRSLVPVLVLIFLTGTGFADEPKKLAISLDDVMSQSRQKKVGLNKLSQEERASLEEWLALFAISIRNSSVTLPTNGKDGVSNVAGATRLPPERASRGIVRLEESESAGPRRVDLGPLEILPRPSTVRGEKPPNNAQPNLYAAIGENHRLKEKVDRGNYLLLEDGSLWEVSAIDRPNTALWLPPDDVAVVGNDSLTYPYKLISGRNVVEARLVAK